MHPVRLAKYSETKRLNGEARSKLRCPRCGAFSFTPYIIEETGKPIDAENCGRCDHEESCGYHVTPKDYYQAHPEAKPQRLSPEEWKEAQKRHKEALRHEAQVRARNKAIGKALGLSEDKAGPCCLDRELIPPTERRKADTALYRYLCSHFDAETVNSVFSLYHVGADKRGRTMFWQIDTAGNVRTAKIMDYGPDGHRAKNPDGTPKRGAMNWAHSLMKNAGRLPDNWKLSQCLFGAHLLTPGRTKPACLVEAEKTAIIAACVMPQYVWLATGGKQNLKPEIIKPLADYADTAGAITVFADLGSREQWADKLAKMGYTDNFILSDLLEKVATDKARAKGMDLADYITGEF